MGKHGLKYLGTQQLIAFVAFNMTMDSSTVKLAELLRHPDDLDKIQAMKLEYVRKKAAVDSQLRSGLKEQLEITQSGMNGITDGQRTVQLGQFRSGNTHGGSASTAPPPHPAPPDRSSSGHA